MVLAEVNNLSKATLEKLVAFHYFGDDNKPIKDIGFPAQVIQKLKRGSMTLADVHKNFSGLELLDRYKKPLEYKAPESVNARRLEEFETANNQEILNRIKSAKGKDLSSAQKKESQELLADIFSALVSGEKVKPYKDISDTGYRVVFVFNVDEPKRIKVIKGANVDVPFGIRRCAEVNAAEASQELPGLQAGKINEADKLDLAFLYRAPELSKSAKDKKYKLELKKYHERLRMNGLNAKQVNQSVPLKQSMRFKNLRPDQLVPCNFCAQNYVNEDFINRGGKLFVVNKPRILKAATNNYGYINQEAKDIYGIKEPDIRVASNDKASFHYQVLGAKRLPFINIEKESNSSVSQDRKTGKISKTTTLLPLYKLLKKSIKDFIKPGSKFAQRAEHRTTKSQSASLPQAA